jgi:glutamate synthase domain-containing protein 3
MMDHTALKHMSVNELVERFVAITQSQYQASLYDEFAKYNKLFREMMAVENDSRAGQATSELLSCRFLHIRMPRSD